MTSEYILELLSKRSRYLQVLFFRLVILVSILEGYLVELGLIYVIVPEPGAKKPSGRTAENELS